VEKVLSAMTKKTFEKENNRLNVLKIKDFNNLR